LVQGSTDPEPTGENHGGCSAHDDVLTEGAPPQAQIAMEFGHRARAEGIEGRCRERAVE
jgi:hypothetical protein